jgi:hypothetical protein
MFCVYSLCEVIILIRALIASQGARRCIVLVVLKFAANLSSLVVAVSGAVIRASMKRVEKALFGLG